MFLSPIVREDIEMELKSLKVGKPPGVDEIGTFLLRHIFGSRIDVLLYIFNLSFESGGFPQKMKEAIVIPVYKKDAKNCPQNYWPMSLVITYSKILEKLMKKKVILFQQNKLYKPKTVWVSIWNQYRKSAATLRLVGL